MISLAEFEDLTSKFNFKGSLEIGENHEVGNINDTYILQFRDDEGKITKYVLQKVNCDVFKNPEELMKNIKAVTEHIKNKIIAEGGNPNRETINLVYTKDGKTHYYCEKGNCWRALAFIDGARTYMKVEEPRHMYTTGKALGKFQRQLNDFNVDDLYETIPDFHNTYKRYLAFVAAVKEDKAGRAKFVQDEIKYIMDREEDTKILINLLEEGKLPLRVTHNDTKFNNIMIDNVTGEGVALIDLDTVMPGLAHYDFGDAVRSGATTAEEDEADLTKVNFDLNLYNEFKKGYLEEMGDCLTDLEKEYLPFSCKLITLELAMRFLTDYLNGDTYFKVCRENHNLDRTRNQLKLHSDMEKMI